VLRWVRCVVVLLLPAACSYPPLPPSGGQPRGPSVITASWSFNTYANRNGPPDGGCPTGFDTAAVVVRPWDELVGDFTGPAVASDLFDCSAKVGTTDPLDGIFQVWVQIENHNGSSVYAQSESVIVDTANGDASVTLPTLFTDAGYFDLSWDLEKNGARVHCADAGIGPSGRISTTAVAISDSSMIVDKFTCTDGFGTTSELPVGSYDVTVTASSAPGMDIGVSDPIQNQKITAPSGLTHLGVVRIPLN
jgi:hypothetical protein